MKIKDVLVILDAIDKDIQIPISLKIDLYKAYKIDASLIDDLEAEGYIKTVYSKIRKEAIYVLTIQGIDFMEKHKQANRSFWLSLSAILIALASLIATFNSPIKQSSHKCYYRYYKCYLR